MTGGLFLRSERDVLVRSPPEDLCLEFVNTVAWRDADVPEERVSSPPALLDWCVSSGILDLGQAAMLRMRWDKQPQDAQVIHRQALALREALSAIFRSRIAAEALPKRPLRVLDAALASAPPRKKLATSGDALVWSIQSPGLTSRETLLAPIVWSAADLLTGARLHRVRRCADERGCGWLFLDESRAGTRRWCSMGECGNRAKARRHFLRGKQAASGHASGA